MDIDNKLIKPGAGALVAIKNQKKSVELFKKPSQPIVKKKSKNIILSEEKYMEVSKIVMKFPM
jgi:hypothetical protein